MSTNVHLSPELEDSCRDAARIRIGLSRDSAMMNSRSPNEVELPISNLYMALPKACRAAVTVKGESNLSSDPIDLTKDPLKQVEYSLIGATQDMSGGVKKLEDQQTKVSIMLDPSTPCWST